MDESKGYSGHDGSCDTDPQKNRGNGLFQPHIQHGGHQRAGPGTGARQRNCHQNAEPDGAVFPHNTPLQVGFGFQCRDDSVPPFAACTHPGKNPPDEHDDKRYREHIAKNRGHQRGGVGETEGNAVRQTAPQFNDRNHRDKEGRDQFPNFGGDEEIQRIHILFVFGHIIVFFAKIVNLYPEIIDGKSR